MHPLLSMFLISVFFFLFLILHSSCSNPPFSPQFFLRLIVHSSLSLTLSSHPSFTATFFLFFHLCFLPSGSRGWCDAGCQSQGYMWYRVGGGGPGVWALWQRQQVQQLPDVCLYPQICPLDASHFLPKIHLSLNHSFFPFLPPSTQPLTKSYAFLFNLKWKPSEILVQPSV